MFSSLRNRLMVLFLGIYLVCLVGLGVFAMQSFSSLTKVTADFKSAVAEASHLAKFQDSVWALRWGFAQYIALGDGNPARAKILADDPKLHAAALKALEDYGSSNLMPEERKGLEGLQVAFKQYYEARAPWFKLMEEGKKEEATDWRAKMTTPFGAATVKALLDQFALQQKAAEGSFEAAALVKQHLTTELVAIFLILLLPIYVISSQARKISTQVMGATHGALAVASGDLSRAIPDGGADEVGQLLSALQRMQGSLQHLVGQVRESSGSIQVASAEVASGTEDLSSRTEQTASSLEQAASSMEQLSGTVEQSAASAKEASQLASSAAQVAARGGEVVGQVVNTMEDISLASRKISDIISVIDGIAFQTNILALNAAVEAARAGEQGRGFAVVASEVRSLAGRSAEAAKEIKALIGASVDKVEVGTRLVSQAGQTMVEIVTSVQQVAHVIGGISAAASEQAKGIAQVTQNVNQLDQMTQQNAALVEESMAAAASLRDQAERMAEVVSTFTLPSGMGQKMTRQVQAAGFKSAALAITKTASPTPFKPSALKAPPAKIQNAAPASASASSRQPAKPESEEWEAF